MGAPGHGHRQDRNPSDTLTYSLSGTDASSFDIDSSTGQILTDAALDFEEGKSTYSVTVEVRDSKDDMRRCRHGDRRHHRRDDQRPRRVNDPPVLTGSSTG